MCPAFRQARDTQDFERILEALRGAGYDGWITVEILPVPDPDTAARQAIEYLRSLIGG
jgi:sugar phosphate isomerase/epimerase